MPRDRILIDLIAPSIAKLAGRLGVSTMESDNGFTFSIGEISEELRFSNLEADFDANRFDKISQEAGAVISKVLDRSFKRSRDFQHGYHDEETP